MKITHTILGNIWAEHIWGHLNIWKQKLLGLSSKNDLFPTGFIKFSQNRLPCNMVWLRIIELTYTQIHSCPKYYIASCLNYYWKYLNSKSQNALEEENLSNKTVKQHNRVVVSFSGQHTSVKTLLHNTKPNDEVFITLTPLLPTFIDLTGDSVFSKFNPLLLQSGECFRP